MWSLLSALDGAGAAFIEARDKSGSSPAVGVLNIMLMPAPAPHGARTAHHGRRLMGDALSITLALVHGREETFIMSIEDWVPYGTRTKASGRRMGCWWQNRTRVAICSTLNLRRVFDR